MGGELRDVPDIHPTLLTIARSAARALGPVVCAVDLIVQDPRAPADSQDAVINEVNTTPGLDVANQPVGGAPSLVAARRILDHLFPEEEASGRMADQRITSTATTTPTGTF
jgi:D-alanine-D-alanine ligase-like ATP-grasp enzyme